MFQTKRLLNSLGEGKYRENKMHSRDIQALASRVQAVAQGSMRCSRLTLQ